MTISVGEFKKLVAVVMKDNPSYRYGQAVFNTMFDILPKRANFYRSSGLDPFYIDTRAEAFINACLVDWRD